MISIVLLAIVLSSLFPLMYQMEIPEPIDGVASYTQNTFKTSVNGHEFTFHFPKGWGLGNYVVTDGKAEFDLLPLKAGLGCKIEAELCDRQSLVSRMKSLENFVKNFTRIKEGFEASFDQGWWACKAEGAFLVRIWFFNTKEHSDLITWQGLKECLTILDPKTVASIRFHQARLTEEPSVGWWCHHPDSAFDLLFETKPAQAKPNYGGTKSYYLQYQEAQTSGYFYVKWNASGLDRAKVYQDHLRLMEAEIKQIEMAQKTDPHVEVDLNQRYAYLSGHPYSFITFAGVDFLFGFAVKPTHPKLIPDLNDFVGRVKWSSKP